MSQMIIITTPTNSGDGTPLATAFNYCNSNFGELYARAQVSPPATLIGSVGDVAGMYAYDPSYFYYCFAEYDGSTVIWAQVTQVANISIAAINNGDSNVKLVGVDGDATVNINGVSNVAVFRTDGVRVTGDVSASGTVTGATVTGTNIIGNQVTGNNVSAVGNVVALNAFLAGALTTGTGFLATDVYPAQLFSDGIVMDYDSANSKARISTGAGDSINFYNDGVGNVEIVQFDSTGNIEAAGGFSAVGNIETQGVVSAVGNIITDGYFVGTFFGNVTGNFVVPGSNTQVIFNTTGNADAVGGFTYNKDSNTLTVLGVVSSQGNVQGGNLRTAGQVSASGAITGGFLNTAGNVSATSNVIGGNILTAGIMSSTGNAIHGNILTAGTVSATGNIRTTNNLIVGQDINAGGDITATSYTGADLSLSGNVTGGNLVTGGQVSAVGNLTGDYILGNVAFVSGLPPTNTIQYGNSNVLIGSSAGNISININGIAPIGLFTPLGQTITGVISATGNVSGGNLTTGGAVSSTGAVTGGSLITGATVSAAGNVRGANLNTDGIVSVTGNVVSGNVVTTGVVSATGNVISTGFVGTVYTNSIINTGANGTGNIGSSTNYFNTVFAKATSAQYADLAEKYTADAEYTPGTVVVFGGDAEITVTTEFADVRVAGAISTNPAYLMNTDCEGLSVALRGRIPVKVVGPVYKGDLLVTAGENPGHAVSIGRSTEYPIAVFAKAIETNTDEGVKVITAVIV